MAGAGCAHDDEPVAKEPPADVAECRHEEQEAERVGDEARRDQEHCGDDEHCAMDQLAAGNAAGIHFAADALNEAEALDPQEDRSDRGRQEDETERRQNADMAPDDDEDRYLEDRDAEKHERNEREWHGDCWPLYVSPADPAGQAPAAIATAAADILPEAEPVAPDLMLTRPSRCRCFIDRGPATGFE